MARRRFSANTVRSIGSLLPSDVLAKVSAGDGLDGLVVADFGYEGDERLRDVVTDAWNEARGLWWQYQSQLRNLDEGDATATSLTRQKWLLPLLGILGFDDIETVRGSLSVGDVEYPISHVWQSSPLHLMGARVGLDERASGIAGAARLSPHSLAQQFLNRSDDHLWGIVSNGNRLRILRDSVSLTRQAFVEFDLEAMFNGEIFTDFTLLFKIAHASRFTGERPEDCLLEQWIAAARDEGIRALDQLRDGVESALTAFGTGFLRHFANGQLRDAVESGALDERELYRYLLRLVYRLLFLFVAEDRDLLLLPEASVEARERYDRFYSTTRLRELAERPMGIGHADLWKGLTALFDVLGRDEGERELGLPGLGSFLWADDAIGSLVGSSLDNEVLLRAIRGLSYVQVDGAARRIDFAGMGAEELGSVYESLLELHPTIDKENRSFALGGGAGSERKTTGSYYTPTELISELLDSALDPVLERAMNEEDPEAAILNLKVVDPAAGSGHFLVAAAHRIGKRLAEVRTGEPEPPNEAYRTAVRDVVSRCLFAVDINDLAVELCKVSLWLEALEPGKPLSFLDHHILHGNSLFGATPSAIVGGIPDEAFAVLTGDDRNTVAELKRRNRRERTGQDSLSFDTDDQLGLSAEIEALEEFADTDLETVRAKERILADWKASPAFEHAHLVADAWCASFAIEKTADMPSLTEGAFRRLRDEGTIDSDLRSDIDRLVERFRFFHWHLAFPQVFSPAGTSETPGWDGGFDVVLGNPPWDKVEFNEREWFAARSPDIASAVGADRKRRIRALVEEDEELWTAYRSALQATDAIRHHISNSERFPLCGRGKINTYAVFAELVTTVLAPTGRSGLVLPTGIATDETGRLFFAAAVDRGSLVSLFDFENRRAIFPGVHRSYKFCLMTLTGSDGSVEEAEFVFFALATADLRDSERRFSLSAEDFALLNPNTRTCPIFRTNRDASITRQVYREVPILRRRGPGAVVANQWPLTIRRVINMGIAETAQAMRKAAELPRAERLPMIEAKLIHQFDSCFASYEDPQSDRPVEASSGRKLRGLPTPRFWAPSSYIQEKWPSTPDWVLVWRDIAPSTNERTLIAAVLPVCATDFTLRVGFGIESARSLAFLAAVFNSFAADYLVRQKLGGTHVSDYVLQQVPIPPPSAAALPRAWLGDQSLESWVAPRVAELTSCSPEMEGFAASIGFPGFYPWKAERRAAIRAELDAALFHAYGVAKNDVDHILESFPIVRRHDVAAEGTFRTKDLVLGVYDSMSEAIESGREYLTTLDPPPADPRLRVDAEVTS